MVAINVRLANRDRDRDLYPKALSLVRGTEYILLLFRSGARKSDGMPAYNLVRGIHGARELPGEGRPAYLQAVGRFLEIQDRGDDRLAWQGIRDLLEETNPMLVETGLDLFLKFRRGDAPLVELLRPLMDHPAAALRARAVRLTDQIVRRHGTQELADVQSLRDELIALARRDPDPEVRIATTEALDGIGGRAAEEVLEQIADHDPDQGVRYAAERLIYERQKDR